MRSSRNPSKFGIDPVTGFFKYPNRCTNETEKVAWYALYMTLEYTDPVDWLPLRPVVVALSLLEDGEASVEEMAPFIGRNWGLCRKTPANLAKYERCLTVADYEDARRRGMNARVDRLLAEMEAKSHN